MERVNSLRYDNRAKMMANEVYNGSMQSLMNITKNQERQSYIKTATDAFQTFVYPEELSLLLLVLEINSNLLPFYQDVLVKIKSL